MHTSKRNRMRGAAITLIVASFGLLEISRALQTPASQPPKPAAAPQPVAYKQQPGPFAVDSLAETWRDEARQRDVPVRIWFPKETQHASPVIIFSHGLGGSRDGYANYGKHWASYGYISVHVQHIGSDDSVWKDNPHAMQAMRDAAADVDNLLGRPRDITFAIDELTRRNAKKDWALAGKFDLARIGVAGHSFGAYTALCTAGRHLVGPTRTVDLGDKRVCACIAMSSPAKERERANGSYADIAVPCFHMTGTKDDSPIGDTTAELRRLPFDAISKSDEYLLVLEGANHMAFSDNEPVVPPRNPAHWPLILSSSMAFWDAYLLHDEAALKWLRDGGFAALLGKGGTFEHKSPSADAKPSEAPAPPKKSD